MIALGFLAGLVACSLWYLSKCWFKVDEGWLAVLTRFGRALPDPQSPKKLLTFGPGLHRKAPWDQVHRVRKAEQNLDLSGEEGGRTCMAEDGTVLRFDSILRWSPVEDQLAHFLFGLENPREHITGLFTCLLRNEIANFRRTGAVNGHQDAEPGTSYDLIRRDRRRLNSEIEELCRTQIGARYGVRFSAVDLIDILPPDELALALNSVMNAQNEAAEQLARTEADCRQRVLAAERGLAIAKAKGAAVEQEVLTLAKQLADLDRDGTLDRYVARRRAEVLSQSKTLYLRSAS